MGCSNFQLGDDRVRRGPTTRVAEQAPSNHQSQHKQEQHQKQHQSPRHSLQMSKCKYYYYSALTVALALLVAASLASQTNCQTSTTKTDCARNQQQQPHHLQRSLTQRQQRQFSGQQQANSNGNQQVDKPARSAEMEQEEFSLSLGPNNQQERASRQQQQVTGQQTQANYTLLNQQQQVQAADSTHLETTIGGQQQVIGATTPAQPSDSIGSPVALQPPATTTSSSLSTPARTNPAVAAQTTTTTEAPISLNQTANVQPSQQATAQQQVATSRQFSGDFGSGDTYLAARAPSVSQPVSSSPSSISIITPLLGPPNQQQQQQQSVSSEQSMVKPIFVVGNPISERDYAPAAPYEHSPTPATTSTGSTSSEQSTQQVAKSPKLVDETVARPQQQQQPSGRSEKSSEQAIGEIPANGQANSELSGQQQQPMSGPQLSYLDGHLNSMLGPLNASTSAGQPRLFQGSSSGPGSGPSAVVAGNSPRRPSLPPPVNQANAASGFRSPMSPSGPLLASGSQQQQQQQQQLQSQQLQSPSLSLQAPANNNNNLQLPNFYQTSPPYAGPGSSLFATSGQQQQQAPLGAYNKPAYVLAQQSGGNPLSNGANQLLVVPAQPQVPTPAPGTSLGYSGRRPLNITRVEHISAECSNDLIRAVIVFNGTFKGIIYSSGYVSDPTCLYVNGTGSTRYEFSIRLNQCGTLGREQLHQPTIPGEARRRDQVMWNTLSIQYNSIIEQEWDEHFRVSCEYGSDFWKTVSFSPFNVETNTGSPVVFTINPPQCQMDVLLGHGMGPKIAVDGPVTVGDPLTLLIHMKSEKAGYDILVKNCVAHNGSKQRMQLIDSNGCVVNERFISPFRGTYNDNDLRHVTLYAYLKAFRFTGSPVLYLECEIHMCQSACPPQMCYWRRLSKRSVDNLDYEYTTNTTAVAPTTADSSTPPPVISDSLSLFKALQVRQESESSRTSNTHSLRQVQAEDEEAALVCYRHAEVCIFLTTVLSLLALLLTIAITCCLRIRQLTRNQFTHNRLSHQPMSSPTSSSSSSSSLSPTLLSPTLDQSIAGDSPAWQQQQQQHLNRHQIARWNKHQQRKQLMTQDVPFGHLVAKAVAPPYVVPR